MGCLPLWTALEESGAVCQDLISFEKKNKKKITLFFFFSLARKCCLGVLQTFFMFSDN